MLKDLKNNVKYMFNYTRVFLKWLIISVLVGIFGGIIGSTFHMSVDYVTEFRMEHGFILFLLPIGGIVICAMYHIFSPKGRLDTNRVIESVRKNEKVPLVMIPLIFISTVITHLLGGSAGREGAALQLGGSIGYNLGKALRLKEKDIHIIIMAGMSSVFAALFGTPLTAAIFALEVVTVGVFRYAGLMPCIVSAVTAYAVSSAFGIAPVRFEGIVFTAASFDVILKIIVLAVMCAVVSIFFCLAISKCEHYMDKLISNGYLRAFTGGAVIVILSLVLNTRDYNGAGMDVITRAISGEARYEAFLLKIIFTAITISAGFKGGEIVPSFFIGSTFGCVFGGLLGIDASMSAAFGFIALFCGVVNCPIASIILSLEVFGGNGILLFALVCSISYMMSGCFGLYKSQKIVYSKLDDEYIDINTK